MQKEALQQKDKQRNIVISRGVSLAQGRQDPNIYCDNLSKRKMQSVMSTKSLASFANTTKVFPLEANEVIEKKLELLTNKISKSTNVFRQ
jgi:hypothetical protein